MENGSNVGGYDRMNELIREAIEDYQKKMSEILSESDVPPSGLEMRQKHAQFKLEAIDFFRKKSIGRPVGVWKLERELSQIFDMMISVNSKLRRDSHDSLDDSKAYFNQQNAEECWKTTVLMIPQPSSSA